MLSTVLRGSISEIAVNDINKLFYSGYTTIYMLIKENPPPIPEIEFISVSLGNLCAFLVRVNDELYLTEYQ